MEQEQEQAAKRSLVAAMERGLSWQEARDTVGLHVSRATAYRWYQRARQGDETVWQDGRQGHPRVIREPTRHWVEIFCRGAPGTPSREVQAQLKTRFGLTVSISQINRLRRILGVPRHASGQQASFAAAPSPGPGWQEGAGTLLLLAAVQQTGLLSCLEAALSPDLLNANPTFRLSHSQPATRRRQVVTLLFLEAVGLQRIRDLRGYSGQALALLTGRPQAYSYRHMERLLAELASVGADTPLTQALACWTASLWGKNAQGGEKPVPVFYVDGHRKAVYADALLPRGLIGRTGKVLGCRALVLLHDREGHPVLVTTHRGDQHLTIGLPAILTHFEQAAGIARLKRIVVDREGMSAEFLAQLSREGRTIVTVLRTDQYTDVESFREVGAFVPLQADRQGKVIREVALARFGLPLPEHPSQELE